MDQLTEKFERVYIDKVSRNSPLCLRMQKLFPANKIEFVETRPFPQVRGELGAKQFSASKKSIFVTEFKGQFFKRCPGAKPGLTCCNYFVLNFGLQCDFNCSYCYLQTFLNTPILTLYSNLQDALQELKTLSVGLEQQKLRIGTGEVVDSLSMDPLTHFSHELIEFFKEYPQWSLEFKTKSDYVDQFVDRPHAGNVIVSWSVNPQYIIEREEHGTASLQRRLAAARKCAERGFPIAFHIDPMIYFDDWKIHYGELVDQIAEQFSPKEMPYISIGALRFQPEQRHMMRQRFGMQSLVMQGELFTSKDGKMRYERGVREQMFNFVIERFKAHDPQWNIFLCMEQPETWLGATQSLPQKTEGLQDLFDHRTTHLTLRKMSGKAGKMAPGQGHSDTAAPLL